ncbi:MAG: acylphosphatase [Ginsengibacter sp.]
MPSVKLLIRGIVQGVFFRATAKKVATSLLVAGTIKNTTEGHVEIFASGNTKQLNEFIEWCRKGPEKAKVENVDVVPIPDRSFADFKILR